MIDKEGQAKSKPESFDALGLKENILRGIYSYGMEKPSSIQSQIIPSINQGRDVIIQAQSGTGKTTACAISILQLMNLEVKECQALIIAPTYELARNIQMLTLALGDFMSVTVDAFKNGENNELQKGAQVAIGTAAKIHHMMQKGLFKVENVKICVVEGIDDIFARGFKNQVQEIFEALPKSVQTVLTFEMRTMSSEIEDFIKDNVKDAETISGEYKEMTLENIKHYYVAIDQEEWKNDTMLEMLPCIEFRKCVIYCNKKQRSLELAEKLREKGLNISEIYGEMDAVVRNDILVEFNNGALQTLITTINIPLTLDLPEKSLIVNYDLPFQVERYLQRVGRKENLERKIVVINFTVPTDYIMLKEIEKHFDIEMIELPVDVEKIFEE